MRFISILIALQTASSLQLAGLIKWDLSCKAKHFILEISPSFPNEITNRETAVFGVSLFTASLSSEVKEELSVCDAR